MAGTRSRIRGRALTKLRVLLVHERYQQPGGEDIAVDADAALLARHGHEVFRYERSNDEIDDMRGSLSRARLAVGTVWSASSARAVGDAIDEARPDVMHVHNTFPLISPSVYAAAERRSIPVVQTIQNLRMACAQGLCTRDALPCHLCLETKFPWPALRYACYRNSRAQTAVVVALQTGRRVAARLGHEPKLYLPVSNYVRSQLSAHHEIPEDRSMVRYNHVAEDPGARSDDEDDGTLVFVGRITIDKGVAVLVEAAAAVPEASVLVVGDGPDRADVEALAGRVGARNVQFTGRVPHGDVVSLMRRARALVHPSVCEDPNPLAVIEAIALGVPVVATTSGGIPEIVGGTGELVPQGDPKSLADAMARAASDRAGWSERGKAARARFEAMFSAERAYTTLLEAYRRTGVEAD